MMSKSDYIKFSEKEIKKLFAYYLISFIICVLCLIISIYFIYFSKRISQIILSGFLLIIINSLVGSYMYYIRKLYKICILKKINNTKEEDKIQKIGVKVYFYIRPIFAVALSVLIFFGIILLLNLILPIEISDSHHYPELCGFVGFFIGFGNGKLIDDIDNKSTKIIDKII